MKIYALLAALVIFTVACEKDNPPPRATPKVVQEQIAKDLADRDNLTEFVEAFEALEMNTEDIAEGITIFAPLDDASGATNGKVEKGARSSSATALTPEVLKDHIIKGLKDAAELADGDTLTTLNGKLLIVTIDGEEVRVNGVLLSEKDITSNQNYVIHTVEQVLPQTPPQHNTGTIEITVWNGAKWSPENPDGDVEAGVTVSLYNSHTDFMQKKPAAYTKETQADGKVTFTNIDADKVYYISAVKEVPNGTIDNVFYEQAQDTVYVGLVPEGIFQNQEEIDAYIVQANDARLGNFRWKDLNGDALIDNRDRMTLPYQEVNATSGETVQVDVTIGYNNNRDMNPAIMNEEEALQTLSTIYLNLNRWQEFLVMADGMLSDDEAACNAPDWCALDNFTFAANHPIITNIWQNAYNNIISHLNLLLRDVPGLSFTDKDQLLAEAKGLRAYIYLQLVTYFGDVPLQTGFTFESDVTRVPQEEVYALISEGLSEAAGILPFQWTSTEDLYRLNADAAKVLLAKAALRQQEWQKAANYTSDILESGRYYLMTSHTEVFESHDNDETIWNNFAVGGSTGMFVNYFTRGAYFPTVRLAEVYLINAEAQNEMGLTTEAHESLNIVRERDGMSSVAGLTNEEFREVVITTWKTVMPLEGSRFANLVRWGKAEEVLIPKGYQPHHNLLPIPQIIIDNYPNIIQNPGY